MRRVVLVCAIAVPPNVIVIVPTTNAKALILITNLPNHGRSMPLSGVRRHSIQNRLGGGRHGGQGNTHLKHCWEVTSGHDNRRALLQVLGPHPCAVFAAARRGTSGPMTAGRPLSS